LQQQQTFVETSETIIDAQLSSYPPSTPSLIPSSPSDVDMAPLRIPEAGMETDGIDDRLSEQEAVLPSNYSEFFPGASEVFGKEKTYMDLFDEDEYANARQTNLYYPFASQPEWELASFLLKSGLSRVAIDQFLKLQLVSTR
jgi:hypothetical protein